MVALIMIHRQPGPPRTQLPVSKIYLYINILQRKHICFVTIGVRSMRRKGGVGGGGGGGGRMPPALRTPTN